MSSSPMAEIIKTIQQVPDKFLNHYLQLLKTLGEKIVGSKRIVKKNPIIPEQFLIKKGEFKLDPTFYEEESYRIGGPK
jgi:DUF1009 family protein